ncbi:PKD domain-containing protein (plasmid) [Deinococcus psychrotolerans]|uniref:PKD domain-containing protein n=1 Tax=Deinococcus psychrotolerans TaxID=2489213 RepID=A0A3G8YGN3_9DEIO|nr:PKD domain-containing protein [Deinococcus psychrotolerans]AZI44458.1 PKD domain-containing protein [Deinococcus psychrotolerans]
MNKLFSAAAVLTAVLGLAACNPKTPPAANTAPVASFTFTPASGPAALSVSTDNTSTDADTADTLTYDWDWGDGSTHDTAKSPSHTYSSAGIFTITLKTTDNHAASSTKTASVTVTMAAPATPAEFFAKNSAIVQKQTFTPGTVDTTLTFAQGTQLVFAPNSVLDASGNPYSGVVNVSVREIQDKSDMILSNVLTVSVPTNADPAPLVSGGMFNLDIKTPAGADLKINPAVGVGAKVPIKDAKLDVDPKIKNPMQQFVGQSNTCGGQGNAGPIRTPVPIPAGDSSVNWCPVAGKFTIDTTTPPGSYVFSVFNKGWINCDFFWNDPRTKTTIHVDLEPINDANTIVFLVPQGIKTVIALYTKDGANARKSYDNSLPIGLNAELVAITFNAGKQYLAHKTITVSAGLSEKLTFSEATDAQIKAYLTSVNGS